MDVRRAVLALSILALAACGGGGSGGTGGSAGGGTGGTGVSVASVSEGVMTVGSVIVNGVRFDDSAAKVVIDDSERSVADLRNGMVVKVRGPINDDRVTGRAERIEVENEVRGTVQSVNAGATPAFFTVVGQKVFVDETTVFAGVSGIGALAGGSSFVEVHGQRDATGAINASRVELFGGTALGDELRGTVSNLAAGTFTLSGVTVNYQSATLRPSGATLANGQPVEAHGSFAGGVFTATIVDREDLEDLSFQPDSGGGFEVEGFITSFSSAAGAFLVNGRPARVVAGTTRFDGGTIDDLRDGVKVEVEGRVSAGQIVADKVSFRRTRILVYGRATTVTPGARTLVVLGQTVRVDDLTDVRPQSGSGLGAITTNNRVEVRGYLNAANQIIAERIDDKGAGGGDDLVQGRVQAENEGARTLTVQGVSATLGAAQFQDRNGQSITAAQFFAAVTPGATTGTLVKVKGSFSGGELTVGEAELED